MGNKKKRILTIICWLAIVLADIFVFLILGLLLMSYDDFYDSSKGEYWSLASMNTTEKIIYICYNIWIVLNIIGLICTFVYIGRKIYKRKKRHITSGGQCSETMTKLYNEMRTVVLIIGLICLTITNSLGQESMPKNLKQTIKFLDEDCPDSLKNIIKVTENKDLKNLSYPWGNSKYKTIFNWLDNEKSGIYKYLTVKGVDYFKVEVILENYKKHLLNEPIDEASLLKPYLEIEKNGKSKTRTEQRLIH